MRRRVSSLVQSRPPRTAAQPALESGIPLVSLIQALSVAEHLNFRHAASALGVSQSSVSMRIIQLEQDLGILLFERRHRGVRLTEAGQHFLDHVATGMEHLEHAVRTAGAIARGGQGRRGGAGPQVHDHIVLRLAEHWSQPRIQRFDVERDTLMSMVAQGYGITLTSEAAARASFPGVVFRPILDEPEPIAFNAVWLPHNRNPALLTILALAQRKSQLS